MYPIRQSSSSSEGRIWAEAAEAAEAAVDHREGGSIRRDRLQLGFSGRESRIWPNLKAGEFLEVAWKVPLGEKLLRGESEKRLVIDWQTDED